LQRQSDIQAGSLANRQAEKTGLPKKVFTLQSDPIDHKQDKPTKKKVKKFFKKLLDQQVQTVRYLKSQGQA